MDKARRHKIGVIGCGYWGTNLVRNFKESPRAALLAVADTDQKRLERINRLYFDVTATRDWHDVIDHPLIEMVAIATPANSHFELGMAALSAGKHVLLAKPMAASSEQCKRLMDAAQRAARTLIVDHTFVYTDAVRKIREILKSGELGKILYYDSMRVNLGLFQTDSSVVWDLAVHDLAIIDYLFGARPSAVSCIAAGHVEGSPENIAFITLFFPNGAIAHINVNWMSPVKVRQILIGGDKKMIIYDDVEPTEKIRIYDRGVAASGDKDHMYRQLMTYRIGGVEIPALPGNEALKTEFDHLFDCIEQGLPPITDGASGLRAVQILEAINLSIARRGAAVDLPQDTDDVRARSSGDQGAARAARM
jgi:predicted dehydrogenase